MSFNLKILGSDTEKIYFSSNSECTRIVFEAIFGENYLSEGHKKFSIKKPALIMRYIKPTDEGHIIMTNKFPVCNNRSLPLGWKGGFPYISLKERVNLNRAFFVPDDDWCGQHTDLINGSFVSYEL